MSAAETTDGQVGSNSAPPPRATYRLQFQKDFTFDDAAAIVPYLARLGISHVYASPIHKARPGSLHGYDVVDHATINPELGGEEGFRRFSDTLTAAGLGLVLDIVPNHVGVGGSDNGWWLSVLEWGELSPYACAFDIDWERLGANRKLVVPFLGNRYGIALETGELALAFDAAEGSFSVWHFEHRFPLCPSSYPIILDRATAAIAGMEGLSDIFAISERLRAMGDEIAADRRAAFPAEGEALRLRLAEIVAGSPALAEAIERVVVLINGMAGIPESFGTLHRLLEAQSYRLAHWRVAASDINYRRFFDINDLAGLRIEEQDIFRHVHACVFRLIREGRVHGLRIDHVDGLADPEAYLRALQEEVGPGFYILVEKILEPGEELRSWPIAGTTGYDMLNLIDGVLMDTASAATLERLYRRMSEVEGRYPSLLRQAKMDVIETSFASEIEALVSDLKRMADADRRTRDYTTIAIRTGLGEIIARFPVYRSYVGEGEPSAEDRRLIVGAVAGAQRHSTLPDRSVHDLIGSVLLNEPMTQGPGGPNPQLVQRFRRRFQQLSGPVMAKGLEDTLFYRYGRLLALNEVGGDPHGYGIAPAAFHAAMAARIAHWPHAMIATATHDTKRGEDARARLLALSELASEWAEALDAWQELTAQDVITVEEAQAPDANDRYIMLQALLGAWPIELLDGEGDAGFTTDFAQRMQAFIVKALREGKTHTSWVNPVEPYEQAALSLIGRLVAPESEFLRRFAPFARRLANIGMLTGLARTALKCTLPGIPDIYQGTEFWDLSLVDPDNRRPVDYASRACSLDQISRSAAPGGDLQGTWQDGRVKQQLLARLLGDRASNPSLYADGDYQPLEASGPAAAHILAFERSHGSSRMVVAVARLLGRAIPANGVMPPAPFWRGTTLSLPGPSASWREVVSGRELDAGGGRYAAETLFQALPVAVLRSAA